MAIFCPVTLLVLALSALSDGRTACYYGSWATYRPNNGHCTIDDLDAFVCDELIYSFAGLDETTYNIKVLDPYNDLYDDWGKGGFERFTNLKQINPALKTTLAVGGWNEGSEKYSLMAADPVKRAAFISSARDLLLKHKFDGLDMDWEYPAYRGGVPQDKENFIALLRELREAFAPHGLSLTAAVSASVEKLDQSYDVEGLNTYLDYIYLMTYDFHGAWDDYTHHHSALRAHPQDNESVRTFNMESAVNAFLQRGADPSKLVLGIASYGRCYALASSSNTGYYAPISGPASPGPYTSEGGFLGYNEICEMQTTTNDWITVLDPSMNEPYSYRLGTNIWCGYDDPQSAKLKGSYAKGRGLGGIMTWSVETDDFRGICGGEKFSLVKSMTEGYKSSQVSTTPATTTTTSSTTPATTTTPTTTPMPTTTTTSTTTNVPTTTTTPTTTTMPTTTTTPTTTNVPTTTTTPTTTNVPTTTTMPTTTSTQSTTTPGAVNPPDCSDPNQTYYPHVDCNKFWQCSSGVASEQSCPIGLVWVQETESCDYPTDENTANCNMP